MTANVTSERLEALERELASVRRRVRALERALSVDTGPEPLPAPPPVPATPPAPARTLPPPPMPRPSVNLEELLGRRLLALVGGAAFVLGLAFFVALAIDRGWIGVTARVALAFLASGLLAAGGAWLYERKGRLQAALAMVGCGIAGLYLSLTAATALYGLVPAPAALLVAMGIGSCAAVIAVRWDSRTVAGLGIVGTLLAPALAGTSSTAGIAFLLVAWASASAVCLWRRWEWLAVLAFAVALPQVALWSFAGHPWVAIVAVLAAAGALDLAAAVGFELRVGAKEPRPSAALLALFGALVVGSLGFYALPHGDGALSGGVWLAALAGAYGAFGVAVLQLRRGTELALVLFATGLTLADIGFGVLAHGVILAAAWAASAAALAAATRRMGVRAELVSLTIGAQLALAIGHTLLFDAPPGTIVGGSGGDAAPAAALAAIVVGAFAAARLVGKESEARRAALDAVSMLALACLTAATVDGLALVAAWAFEAAALAEAGRRADDRVASAGALGFLALAAGHALVFEAPPEALLFGSNDLWQAAVALGLVAAAALRVAPAVPGEWAKALLPGAAAVAVFYLCSIAIVTPFDSRQDGQLLLSVFWAACGFGGLVAGLVLRRRRHRLWGFGLLLLAVAKVFVYDLAALDSIYRVASFVVLGLLLLAAAFAYQRLRDGMSPPPDGLASTPT
jgi:Predicted membrane protein (DUF2339)